MLRIALDLHVHSRRSPDGRMSLREIAERSRAAGLDGCAVCDHDRVLPEEDVRELRASFPGFLLIPGVEVSTEYGHLLGWFVREAVPSGNLARAAEAIHAQGGIAVLAHPFEHSRNPDRIAPVAALLDGAEVWNSRAERKNRRANAMAETFAADHGLRRFGGSDAHVPREIGLGVTRVSAAARTEEAVKAALLSGETEVSGTRSLAVDTAASQFILRKRNRAGFLSWCKWAAFAGKCWIEDRTGRPLF